MRTNATLWSLDDIRLYWQDTRCMPTSSNSNIPSNGQSQYRQPFRPASPNRHGSQFRDRQITSLGHHYFRLCRGSHGPGSGQHRHSHCAGRRFGHGPRSYPCQRRGRPLPAFPWDVSFSWQDHIPLVCFLTRRSNDGNLSAVLTWLDWMRAASL